MSWSAITCHEDGDALVCGGLCLLTSVLSEHRIPYPYLGSLRTVLTLTLLVRSSQKLGTWSYVT
jgi:Na+-translocating ferredoxin:NAD+ oxidoreductase RnfD subunit